ncbi:NADP oxidoreductase [Nocardioides mangrovicus]|uniref:NADP oxidoreductase n=1 Tax=Nocardioides mangrovicus TaxID=2478913 RepID=A0A3L8P5Q2_9ACTN|nr:NAD(P)-binding domain-containing protein [Nocardioides mangrovicus]RLV50720.1 NADP oxidoreductase [Nocardioides mangrovicus]
MTTISIIGTGNMATAIGIRAARYGHTVEIIGRDRTKARAAVETIGDGAHVGTYGAEPNGDLVFLAVLHQGAVEAVRDHGDALAGKTLVDITNPFNDDGTGVVTTEGHSVTQQIAAAAPPSAHVLKAFNTTFRDVLAQATPLDVLFAGHDEGARAQFAAFARSLDLRPLDTGGLEMTYVLEWAAILLMGLARNGAGWDVSLGAQIR